MQTHEHSHPHGHHEEIFHSHTPAEKMKKAFFWTMLIFAIELTGGWLSHSLALLSDAGHVLTDLGAIGLTWYALKQAERPSDQRMTYGYYRSGILAAFINALSLILITIWILWEATARFHHPEPLNSTWMFVSATIGLLLNLYLGFGLWHIRDMNVKSSVLHMLGDAAASAGVILGGILITWTHWSFIDPLLSVFIALFIAVGALRILKHTLIILMEGMPKGILFDHVVSEIKHVAGVEDVHDVHVWSITSGINALSCHVVLDGNITIRESQKILRDIEHRLFHLGIHHVTIQMEDLQHPHSDSQLCATCENPLHHD